MCLVKTGDVIQNNDPRWVGTLREVKRVDISRATGNNCATGDNYAVYNAGQREAKINTVHIYNDGKKRRTGWTLISHGDTGLASGQK